MRSCVALSGLSYSRNSANKALSRHSAEQRISHRNHRTSSALNYNVLVRKLVKAWTWVNADAVLGNASTHKTASLIAQKAHDLAHDRRLFRQGKTALRAQRACLGSCGCGSSSCATSRARRAHIVQLHLLALNTSSKAVLVPVHHNAATVRFRSYSNHFWIGEASNVVDDGGSKTDTHLCYLGVARVDGDNCSSSYQRAYHGYYTLSLFCRQNRRVTWTSRLSPNVNDVGTLIQHLQSTSNCSIRIKVLSAIRERIWSDVENTHNPRACQRESVSSTLPGVVALTKHESSLPAMNVSIVAVLTAAGRIPLTC